VGAQPTACEPKRRESSARASRSPTKSSSRRIGMAHLCTEIVPQDRHFKWVTSCHIGLFLSWDSLSSSVMGVSDPLHRSRQYPPCRMIMKRMPGLPAWLSKALEGDHSTFRWTRCESFNNQER
jgi:hypothetical protein